MNHYETVFILTPVLSEAQMKEAVEKFKTLLTDNGGAIVNEESWGLRKLAYPIAKKSTGFYTLLEFDGEPTIVKKLETAFRRDEKVLRFLITYLDKFAEEYAVKRRTLKKAAKEQKTEVKADEKPAAKAEAKPEPVVKEEAPAAEPEAKAAEGGETVENKN